jgi:phenylalanyl-tRNA synthetase beta chain
MKISYKWLKELADFNLSPKETAELITFAGIETNIDNVCQAQWQGVITAKVLESGKHPHADKLSLCVVTDGKNNYSVVCGAPNVAAGQTIALATAGAELPGGLKIKKTKIRGIESEGMICSEKELGLPETVSGIMVLPEGTPLGKPLQEVLG